MLVLDFDGTMTDAEVEGSPFKDGYLHDLAAHVGRPVQKLQELYEQMGQNIAQDPGSHGWLYNGQIVAPAQVDPYLRIKPIARMILEHFNMDPEEFDWEACYLRNYRLSMTAFRPGARELLVRCRDQSVPTHIVTNSDSTAVRLKLFALGHDYARATDPMTGLEFLTYWLPRLGDLPGSTRLILNGMDSFRSFISMGLIDRCCCGVGCTTKS